LIDVVPDPGLGSRERVSGDGEAMATNGIGDSGPVRKDQHAAGIQEQRFQAIHDSLYVGA
jgi:hypothetical protein